MRKLRGLAPAAAIVVAAVVVVVLSLVGANGRDDSTATHPPPGVGRALIVDADAHGAVVLSRNGVLIGYRSDGTVTWRDPDLGRRSADPILCLARCPDVAASGADKTYGKPERPDPPIVFYVGERRIVRKTIVNGERAKGAVIWAASRSQWIEWRARLGGSQHLLLRDGNAVLRIPLAGPRRSVPPTAVVNPDATRALVLAPRRGSQAERLWLTRADGSGWQLAASGSGKGDLACLDGAGRVALIRGQRRPELVHYPAMSGSRIYGLPYPGDCEFSAIGPVITSLTAGSAPRSLVVQLDSGGEPRWHRRGREMFRLSASPDSKYVLVVGAHQATVLDGRGKEVRAIQDVDDAVLLRGGWIVALHHGGGIDWRH